MIAARDGLCPYKGPDRRLLSGEHKDSASKLKATIVSLIVASKPLMERTGG